MTRSRLNIAFVSLFLSLILSHAQAAQAAQHHEDVRIPVESNLTLKGTLSYDESLSERAPLVLLLNPWGFDSSIYNPQIKLLTEKGFVVLAFNLRGWRGSDGAVQIGGPLDISDVSRAIDWAAERPMVDSSRVGIGGISLGGGVALLAAAFEPRIKAVASLSGWSDFYTPIFGYNTKRTGWDTLLLLGSIIGTGSPAAAMTKELDAAIAAGDYARIHAYSDIRSPNRLLERYKALKPAVLLSKNFSDILFPISDTWAFFESLELPKKLSLQPGIHGTAEVDNPIKPDTNIVWRQSIAWFERWLGPSAPDHDRPLSELEIHFDKDHALTSDAFESTEMENLRLYLKSSGPDAKNGFGILTPDVPSAGEHRIESGLFSGIETGLPVVEPWLTDHGLGALSIQSKKINTNKAAIFEYKPSEPDFLLAGIPKLHLTAKLNNSKAQLILHLFRVTEDDTWSLISVTPYTFLAIDPSLEQNLEIELYGAFEQFHPGDKLVFAIDTFDPNFSAVKNKFTVDLITEGQSWLDIKKAPMNMEAL